MGSGKWWAVFLLFVLGAVGAAAYAEESFVAREEVGRISTNVSFDVKDAKVEDVIGYVAKQTGHNIVVVGDIPDRVTLRLVDVAWRRALDLVVQQFGGVVEEDGPDIIRVSKPPTVSFELEEAPLKKVITIISKLAQASVVTGPTVTGTVTAQFYDVPWTTAMNQVVRTNGYVILKEGKVLQVVDPRTLETQLVTRVFQLRYLQPPDLYVAKIETEFADRTAAAATPVAGVAGTGEVLGAPVPLVGQSMQRGGSARSANAGAESTFKLLEALRRVASQKGRIDYVDTANAIIVTDTEPNVRAIAELLETIDTEPLQAFIDVHFVTTDMTNRFRYGIDWANGFNVSNSMGGVMTRLPFNLGSDAWPRAISVTGAGVTTADIASGIADSPDGRSGPFTFGILDFSQMTQTLEFFASDAGSEIKQAPKILVLDNHIATIFVGDTIRFAETDSASNQAGGVQVGIREASSSPVQTGFQLWVQPHIIPSENKIILTVIPEAEVLSGKGQMIEGFDDFTNGQSTIQLPRVRSSTVITKLILQSGQTAVLGGLVNETSSDEVRKVPVLGDIPGLGWLFKWKSDLKVKNNLMIFVTVRIVHNGREMREVYTAYGERYGGRSFQGLRLDEMKSWGARLGGRYEAAPNAPVPAPASGPEGAEEAAKKEGI